MNRKISLPLIQKSEKGLMPEILPDPCSPLQPSAAARDRVRARLQKMREGAAVLAAAAASLGAGCSEQHGSGGTPPPPAGNGAAGTVVAAGSDGAGQAGAAGRAGAGGTAGSAGRTGAGGVAGYAVVDPMPLPFVCSKAPAFTNSNTSAEWAGSVTVRISARVFTQDGSGAFLKSASTTAGNVKASVAYTGFPASAQLDLQGGSWPKEVLVDLDFMCRLDTGGYGTHRVTLRLDTSKPALMGTVPILVGGDEDAGI